MVYVVTKDWFGEVCVVVGVFQKESSAKKYCIRQSRKERYYTYSYKRMFVC